jgi:outer membrane protein assembly factor BamB
VYAEARRVWSDAPVGERYESTPYWALRRWPAQVVGVVAAEPAGAAIVVSQWSDGEIVALDARRGVIAWRIRVPIDQRGYDGRRTGASVVYEPRSLLTVRTGERVVLIVTRPGSVAAYDAATGAALWHREVSSGCEPRAWTGETLLVLPDCAGPSVTLVTAVDGRERARWTGGRASSKPPAPTPTPPTPAPAPALCEINRSECGYLTAGDQTWRLGPKAQLTAVPALEPGAMLAGARIVYPTPTGVAARPVSSKDPLWTWVGEGELVGADAAGVYVLTDDRTVLGLSPTTGHLIVLGCASSVPNEGWRVGHVYTTGDRYIALERVTNQPPTVTDRQYFYGARPVALVELYPPTKLPVWPGKFAACRSPRAR